MEENEYDVALRIAQGTLARDIIDNPDALDVLGDACGEVATLQPAFALMPEGGLLKRLMMPLEDDEEVGELSANDSVLLTRLGNLKRELDTMDWSDVRAWKAVRRQIDGLNLV